MIETMTDSAALADDWVEVEPDAPRKQPKVTRHIRPKGDLDAPRDDFGICLCWRCRGRNLPTTEMRENDRILGRHLARQSVLELAVWRRDFQSNGRHTSADFEAIERWIDLANGAELPEPIYTPATTLIPGVE